MGYNQFAYCFNNPVNMSDSSGNWPKWLTGTLNVISGVAQGAMECKQFGFSLSETIEFGSKYGQNLIAKATVPNSMISQLYTGGVGGIDTPIFKSGTLTVPYEMLEAFNEAVAGTIQIMP